MIKSSQLNLVLLTINMAFLLIKSIRSVLQTLQRATGRVDVDEDINPLCDYLCTQTSDGLEIQALAIILNVRNKFVHYDKLEIGDWKDFARALSTLEIWYKDLQEEKDPIAIDSPSLIFSLLAHLATREATVLQKIESGHFSDSEEKVEEDPKDNFVIVDTLKNLRDNGWRDRLKGWPIRILEGTHAGVDAILTGWSGTVVYIYFKDDNEKQKIGISTRRRVGVLPKKGKFSLPPRKIVYKTRVTHLFKGNTPWKDKILGKSIIVTCGPFCSLEGLVTKVDEKRKSIMFQPVGDVNIITLSERISIGIYEDLSLTPSLQEENTTSFIQEKAIAAPSSNANTSQSLNVEAPPFIPPW